MSAPAPSMFTTEAQAAIDRLGWKKGKANLEAFAETLQEIASADRNVLAVTSDSRGSGKLGPFGKALPDQIVEIGIAEQNLVGVAAGLGSTGKKVFAVSPSCFLSARSIEQIKNDVCYSDIPVVLVGISAGVSYGALGTTHHSLHDLAALRAISNVTILCPADNFETQEAVRFAAQSDAPVFLRFGKMSMIDLPKVPFHVGKASQLRGGNDVAFIATGETVVHCLLAAELLAAEGIQARVLSMHTVKPLDRAAVLKAAAECRVIVTAEEHSIHGGLGEGCAAILMQAGASVPFRIAGLPDEDTVTGSQADIFRHYGLSMEGLSSLAKGLLKQAEVSA